MGASRVFASTVGRCVVVLAGSADEQVRGDQGRPSDGLDVLPDIERYARSGWEAITDDDKARLKWYGLFFRKHTPGYFMLRIRIPNGIATRRSDAGHRRHAARVRPR